MTKREFWVLNVTGAAAAFVLLFNVYLGYSNRQFAKKVQQTQATFSNIPAFEKVSQNLLLKIASLSRTDKTLQNLLAKYKFEVKFQE